MFVNVNGLVNKLPVVQLLVEVVNFDILGITETHLSESVSDNWIRIPGFHLVRNDRDNRGGGVLIYYYKESLLSHQVTTWDHPNLEATWLNVTVRSQSFLVGCIYRPPSDCSLFDDFRNQVTEIWMKRKNIILVGDFNCDMTPSLDSNESHFGKRFKRILCSYGLNNIIDSPTRITLDSKSLIDLIVTSQPAKIQISGSIDLGISDHHLIYAVF